MAKFIKGDIVVVPFPFSDLTATARRMPRPVDGDEGGRMEIEVIFLCSQ